jgi:hypothetical protein
MFTFDRDGEVGRFARSAVARGPFTTLRRLVVLSLCRFCRSQSSSFTGCVVWTVGTANEW